MTRTILKAALLALTLGLFLQPVPAVSGSVEYAQARRKDPFKDLPGVQVPEDELKAKIVCRTKLRYVRDGRYGRRYPLRVYVCRDGNIIYQGTTPPMEYDWRHYKQHQRY